MRNTKPNEYIQMPYLPQAKVKAVLIDYRTDEDILSALDKEGIEIIKTVPCKELYEAINGHPDIIMHHMGGNRIILAPNIFDTFAPVLQKKGFALTKGDTWLARNYPGNIAYNILRVGSVAFHNTKYTDRKILEEFEKQNIKIVHINQGYSKCSVCIVNENTIITSDYKIAKTVEKYNIECLLIKPGGIVLKGLSYGFLGGASGLISGKILAVTGSISHFEDHNRILEFLQKKDIKLKILSNKQIVDLGSIIPLTYCVDDENEYK